MAPGLAKLQEKGWVLIGLLLWAFLQCFVIFRFEGTFDAGDSVMHYLFARHAWAHPENLMDQWAKPIFTLFASPFAQFGWPGMKAFQCLLALGTAWMAYQVARKLGLRFAWSAPIFILFAPDYFLAQFSGLTEPLFGAVLIAGIWAILDRKLDAGALILSLLPFIRTEGFPVLVGFGIYFLLSKKWRAFLLLGATTVVFALLGAIVTGDWLWVLNQNPYNKGLENYGSGTWGHFFEQYQFVVGIPIYVLTILGFAGGLLRFRNSKNRHDQLRMAVLPLIWLPFLIYFGCHVVFWATGTGHSLGMSRVLIAIIPLGGLIILNGIHGLLSLLPANNPIARWIILGVIGVTVIFPFLPNPAALKLPKDLELELDQRLVKEAAMYLNTNFPDQRPIYVSHPSYAMFADIDLFDPMQMQRLTPLAQGVPEGSILVWDSWFSVMEDGVSASFWEEEPGKYKLLKRILPEQTDSKSEVRIYQRTTHK